MAETEQFAVYQIERAPDGWIVRHDDDASMVYATREAAFEAAVPKVSLAVKQGFSVRLDVAPSAEDESVQ